MDDLPEPLVPPEVDLRDYDYIPLYGSRLFDSETWGLCDADEKVAALQLWWGAWHEEPAGSLPDNDRLLAQRAGYGVALKAFLTIKEKAMRGWIKCADGRLYHPVVASIALDVWRTKRKKTDHNAAERERKRLKRDAVVRRTNGVFPPDTPPDNGEIPASVPQENALNGKGKESSEASASAAIPPMATPIDPEKEMWDAGVGLLVASGISVAHARSVIGQWRRDYGPAATIAAFRAADNECASDPIGFITACLQQAAGRRPRAASGKTPSPVTNLYEGAFRAAEAVIARDGSHPRDSGDGEPPALALLDSH